MTWSNFPRNNKGPDNPTCVALCVRKTRVEEKEGEKRRRRFVACRLHKVKGDKRRVWDELDDLCVYVYVMSCVKDEIVSWGMCEMSCVMWVVWKMIGVRWGMMRSEGRGGEGGSVWDESSEWKRSQANWLKWVESVSCTSSVCWYERLTTMVADMYAIHTS